MSKSIKMSKITQPPCQELKCEKKIKNYQNAKTDFKVSNLPNCSVRNSYVKKCQKVPKCQKMSTFQKYPTAMSGALMSKNLPKNIQLLCQEAPDTCHKPLCLKDDRRQKKDYKKMRKKDCRYENMGVN